MISLFWLFVGAITGLIIVSIFEPAKRGEKALPTPNDSATYKTPTGCVKFKTEVVDCDGTEVSLNTLANGGRGDNSSR